MAAAVFTGGPGEKSGDQVWMAGRALKAGGWQPTLFLSSSLSPLGDLVLPFMLWKILSPQETLYSFACFWLCYSFFIKTLFSSLYKKISWLFIAVAYFRVIYKFSFWILNYITIFPNFECIYQYFFLFYAPVNLQLLCDCFNLFLCLPLQVFLYISWY